MFLFVLGLNCQLVMQGAAESTLNLRIPSWSDSGSAKAELNGQKLMLPDAGANLIYLLENKVPCFCSDVVHHLMQAISCPSPRNGTPATN